jgi:hypothetical protein
VDRSSLPEYRDVVPYLTSFFSRGSDTAVTDGARSELFQYHRIMRDQIGDTQARITQLNPGGRPPNLIYSLEIRLCELKGLYWQSQCWDPSRKETPEQALDALRANREFNAKLEAIIQEVPRRLFAVIMELDQNYGEDEGIEEEYEAYGPIVPVTACGKRPSTPPPASEKCPICMEPYTDSHPAYQLHCGHFVGISCLAKQINSPMLSANKCTLCRHELFPTSQLRSRRPVGPDAPRTERRAELYTMFQLFMGYMISAHFLYRRLHGRVADRETAQNVVQVLSSELRRRGARMKIELEDRDPALNPDGNNVDWDLVVSRDLNTENVAEGFQQNPFDLP